MSSCLPSICHVFIALAAVSSAHVQPHPNRLRLQSLPPLRPPLPLFEKSNVLVMYATRSFIASLELTAD